MPEFKSRFREGQNVKYSGTGAIGTVNKVIAATRSYHYRVTIEGQTRTIPEMFLEPVPDAEEDIVRSFEEGKLGSYKDYEIFHIWFRLSEPIGRTIYSYLGSKTIFNRFQFKPLLRFLAPSSEERLFIADEVGVGKTIETGIIIKELIARERLDYQTPILIVCPYSLGPKWTKEMRERFSLHFRLHDGQSLNDMLKTAVVDGTVLPENTFSVVGLQLLRREEYLLRLTEIASTFGKPLFALTIIDEAHHMRNTDTDSNRLGNILSSISDMMLMLSATPLNLKNEDLFNQMHILNPTAFPDVRTFEALQSPVIKLNRLVFLVGENSLDSLGKVRQILDSLKEEALGQAVVSHPIVQEFVERLDTHTTLTFEEKARYRQFFISLSPLFYSFTRTQKREAFGHQVYREVHELPVKLSSLEMDFQNQVLEAVNKHFILEGVDPQAIGLILNTHRRMVSSCIPATAEYLKWAVSNQQVVTYGDEHSDELDDDDLPSIGLDVKLKQSFLELIEMAKRIESVDSKYTHFKNMLDKILSNPETPQVIVFSFFIRTLEYLERRLKQEGYTVGIIHGKIPLQGTDGNAGRYETMSSFQNGDFKILLSSEVGGEGLDFQYCHAIVNYDMPYNPMRVEQRIGRIDRFGQEANKIIVANLFIKKTVDEEIYDRLYRRIRLVEDGIGSLEPILGNALSDLQTAVISGSLSEEQKDAMQKRIEDQIAIARIQIEDFEKRRNELLSDDYLSTSIDSVATGEFISPKDALQLTDLCLRQWKGCKFIEKGQQTAEISLSEDIVLNLERFLMRPGNEGGFNELSRLLNKKTKVSVVFNGTIADRLPDHLFLSPTGSWSKFLVQKLAEEKSLHKTFSVTVLENPVLIENCVIFFYHLKTEGVKCDIEFIAIPVSVAKEKVIETDFAELPRIIQNFRASEDDISPVNLKLDTYLLSASERVESIIDERKTKFSVDNQYKIDVRMAALQRSADATVNRFQTQIERHISERNKQGRLPDENYLRLTNARIENEKNKLKGRLDDLRKRKNLALDYRLEAIAYVKIQSKNTGEVNDL